MYIHPRTRDPVVVPREGGRYEQEGIIYVHTCTCYPTRCYRNKRPCGRTRPERMVGMNRRVSEMYIRIHVIPQMLSDPPTAPQNKRPCGSTLNRRVSEMYICVHVTP